MVKLDVQIIKKGNFKKRLKDSKYLIMLVAPAVLYFIIFHYLPMWGVLIAFQRYNIFKGFWESDWVGFKHFIDFFKNPFAFRLIRKTCRETLNCFQP